MKSIFLTTVVQLGYLAVLVQAFVVPPPIKPYRPCACVIIAPDVIKRLILLNQFPSNKSDNVINAGDKTVPGQKICGERQSTGATPVLNKLQLSPQLEKLMFSGSIDVDLCLRIDATGKVTAVHASSSTLANADERLIELYVVEHWTFQAAKGKSLIAGSYPLTLGVYEERDW